MGRKSVLIFILVVVETFVGNDLRNRQSLVINDRDRDLTGLDVFLYKDPLVVGSRIVDGSLKLILGFND